MSHGSPSVSRVPSGRLGLAAGVVAIGLAVAWVVHHEWRPETRKLERFLPGPRSGDEPHYLLVVHSLLQDGDLRIDDEYQQAKTGGPESGSFWRGTYLDHHTIFLDPQTGRTVLWQEVWDIDDPRPCVEPDCVPFRQRREAGFPDPARVVEVPAHPPAFPLALAATLWPLQLEPERVERRAHQVLVAVALATLVVTAAAAMAAGLGPGAALAAAALLGLASPWLGYAKSFYSENPAALAVAIGLWALLARRPTLAGLAAALGMWMKPALVVVGAGWLLERWLAGDRAACVRLAGVMGAAGVALLVFNELVLGRPVVSGGVLWQAPSGLESFVGTLLALDHGLLTFTPWLAVALPGLLRPRAWSPRDPLVPKVAIPFVLHWSVLSLYGTLGGVCYGPRYWIPFLPSIALSGVWMVRGAGRPVRWLMLALAVAAAVMSVSAALQYPEVWDLPPYTGLSRMLAVP